MPSIIAENGGYDSAQLVSELKAKHILGESTMVSFAASDCCYKMLTALSTQGLNMTEGQVGCMQELGITESFSVKRQVLVQASEAAEMILRLTKLVFNSDLEDRLRNFTDSYYSRVDDILKAAPRQREQDRSHC